MKKQNLLEKSEELATKLEKANEEAKDLIKEQEKEIIRKRIGGRSFAGTTAKNPDEESNKKLDEEVKKIVSEYLI